MKKTNIFTKLIWVTLIIFTLFIGVRLYYRLTDDFRIANITYEMPYNTAWETPPLTEFDRVKLKTILNQQFDYIGKGAQSYVFISQDKKHVIKFFKFKHLKPKWWVDALPNIPYFSEYRDFQRARKKRLLNSVFDGYKLAFSELKDESGIVFLHLNKTDNLNATITLIDKIGRIHLLKLDQLVFVVQENAKTTRQVILNALAKNDITLIKKKITDIFDLYRKEYSKGIYDRDHGVMHNTGFVKDKLIHLDAGKLTKDDKMKEIEFWRPDLEKIGNKFEVWFRVNYPEQHLVIAPFLEEKLSQAFGENFKFEK